MEKEKYILETARLIYLQLPFWKRWQFQYWSDQNNWDVKGVYTECLREAVALWKENKMHHELINSK